MIGAESFKNLTYSVLTLLVSFIVISALSVGVIAPPACTISIAAPAPGSSWSGAHNIVWNANSCGRDFDIFHNLNGAGYPAGNTGNIVNNIDTGNNSGGTYAWGTANASDGSSYKIKVCKKDRTDECGESSTLIIDNTAPSGGSITYTDGYYTSASVPITYSTGSDATAGLNLASGKIERASATLTGSTCGSFGAFSTLATESDGSYTDAAVSSGNCYKYRYTITDSASPSNTVTYTSSNIAKIVICGNGVLETGEQCESPFDACCNPSTCQFEPASTTCRAAAGACDAAETCSGSDAACPVDGFQPLGTPCTNGFYCDGPETCDGSGNCAAGTAVDCSGNDISGISTCGNTPDDNPLTFDFRNPFSSVCVNDGADVGHCTTGDLTITNTCSIATCGAGCEPPSSQACTTGGLSGSQDCSAGCTWGACVPYITMNDISPFVSSLSSVV
jgi:hypothetical protein